MHLQTLVARRQLTIARTVCTDPNVYQVTDRGLRAIADDIQKTRRNPIGNHIVHELLITELAVSISELARSRVDLRIPWQRRFELAGDPAFRGLVPDYAFLFSHPRGSLICFAEIFSGEESVLRIGQKFEQYAAWATRTSSQEALLDIYRTNGALVPRPHFRLLAVAHNRRSDSDDGRLVQILGQAVGKLPPEMHKRVWGTTVKGFEQSSVQDPWVRATDLSIAIAPAKATTKRQRHAAMVAAVRQAKRYSLFPPPTESNNVAPPTD